MTVRRRAFLVAGGFLAGIVLAGNIAGGPAQPALSSSRTPQAGGPGGPASGSHSPLVAPLPSQAGSGAVDPPIVPPGSPIVPPGSPVVPIGEGPNPGAQPIVAPELAGRLDAALERLRRKFAIPGISATIVFGDGSTWTGTAGLADVRANRPVTADTAFAIASMSKTFTAALVLDLVADGKLKLDAPVEPLLPDLRIDPRITVRMLLDHTSGLADYFLNPKIEKALRDDRPAEWTAEQALSFVGPAYFRPGRGWKYSNTNYLVLGLLAEKVGGKPLGTQLRERFFDPLGLDTAFDQVTQDPRGPVAHGYRFAGTSRTAKPIDLSDGSGTMPFRSVVTAARGAGAIAASSIDLARWGWALYGGRVLDPAVYGAMLTDAKQTKKLRPRVPYGLGVQLIRIDGFQTLGHSGRLLGSQGALRYVVEEDAALAILTNQSRTDPAVIVRELLKIAFPAPPAGAPPDSAPAASGAPLGG